MQMRPMRLDVERECENCGTRFTTFEHIEVSPLIVVKKDGTREQFLREKY